MSKLKLTQAEIDKLVVVERMAVPPTVCGVGVVDVDFRVHIGRKATWQYVLWTSMLERGFSDKVKAKHPTYQDVTVCDEWLSFATFLEWINKEVGYKGKLDGYQFDKDLIIKGNRVYSPEACSFVPQDINKLLVGRGSERGRYPVGVCFHKQNGWFIAKLNCRGVVKHLGYYPTPEEAFSVYKTAKEAHIKVVALQYKGVLKPAVFGSLMNWEIGIGD